ncbi:MAG: hypothetical protein WBD53_21335, partial [Xanthobacteraceae bacterium]
PSTCAQTATVPRNKLNDANSIASSSNLRTISHYLRRTKTEHSSLYVLSQLMGGGPDSIMAAAKACPGLAVEEQ